MLISKFTDFTFCVVAVIYYKEGNYFEKPDFVLFARILKRVKKKCVLVVFESSAIVIEVKHQIIRSSMLVHTKNTSFKDSDNTIC